MGLCDSGQVGDEANGSFDAARFERATVAVRFVAPAQRAFENRFQVIGAVAGGRRRAQRVDLPFQNADRDDAYVDRLRTDVREGDEVTTLSVVTCHCSGNGLELGERQAFANRALQSRNLLAERAIRHTSVAGKAKPANRHARAAIIVPLARRWHGRDDEGTSTWLRRVRRRRFAQDLSGIGTRWSLSRRGRIADDANQECLQQRAE